MAKKLELNHPWLVAVWPGMGNVALNAGIYLLSKLDMNLIAEFVANDVDEVDQIEVKEGLIQMGRQPRNRLFVWIDPKKKHDLVVFLGESQPRTGIVSFCRQLIECGSRSRRRARLHLCGHGNANAPGTRFTGFLCCHRSRYTQRIEAPRTGDSSGRQYPGAERSFTGVSSRCGTTGSVLAGRDAAYLQPASFSESISGNPAEFYDDHGYRPRLHRTVRTSQGHRGTTGRTSGASWNRRMGNSILLRTKAISRNRLRRSRSIRQTGDALRRCFSRRHKTARGHLN